MYYLKTLSKLLYLEKCNNCKSFGSSTTTNAGPIEFGWYKGWTVQTSDIQTSDW